MSESQAKDFYFLIKKKYPYLNFILVVLGDEKVENCMQNINSKHVCFCFLLENLLYLVLFYNNVVSCLAV